MLRNFLGRLGRSSRAQEAFLEAEQCYALSLLERGDAEKLSKEKSSVVSSRIQKALERETVEIFRSLDEGSMEAARLSAIVDAGESGTSTQFGKVGWDEQDAVKRQMELLQDCIQKRLGFFLSVEDSCIENAGQGVFINGEAEAGRIIAFYPGVVYLPYQVKNIIDELHRKRGTARELAAHRAHEELFGTAEERNAHAIERVDGTVINAANGSVSRKPNFFAVGHKINHPPKGVYPNVLAVPFDFTSAFVQGGEMQAEWKSYIPNALFEDPKVSPRWWGMLRERTVFIQSLVFISTRDLQNREEVLVDYRFRPNLPAPDWYSPVDLYQNYLRWGMDPPTPV